MRGVVIFLGLLLLLGGGAVAAAQYVPVDLSPYLSSIPGAQDFLKSQMALYAGGGAAAFGLLLMIIAMATGGSKKPRPAKSAPAPKKTAPAEQAQARDPAPEPVRAAPPKPQPKPAPKPAPQPQPVAAAPRSAAAPSPASGPSAKPQASARPPASAQAANANVAPTWTQDPRLLNRKRVSDLVTINDALKAYHTKHGAFPKADGLRGFVERGKAWIPGLAPDFIAELPRDPAQSDDPSGPQYLYSSNGKDYKLLAHGVALAGGTNVEVLGVRIDASRNPTWEKASFGFWTEAFATV
jgi:outer membrane biosynthesis protein TonB